MLLNLKYMFMYDRIYMTAEKNDEMDIQPVKMRKVGGSWTLTVSAALVRTKKALRAEAALFKARTETTKDGRTLLIFELVRHNEEP